MRPPSIAALAAAAALTLTACGTITTPAAGRPSPHASTTALSSPGPPAGTRPEAATLARHLLSRLLLPSGARRLPPTSLPPALTGSAFSGAAVRPSLDQYQLFALPQPLASAAAYLAAHVPPGLGDGGTGGESGPGGPALQDVTYLDHQLPAGIVSAQLVLSVVPASSGGSLLRADAQVIWYPPRTAAEYLDAARYHVLTITVLVYGRHVRTVHKVITSPAFIARLATTLNQLPAEPDETISCPADFEDDQISFSVSATSRPAVIVQATQSGCGGAGITVGGRPQPALDDRGTVAALVGQEVRVTPQI